MTAPLLLVDGHNLLFRSWFGFPTRIWNRNKSTDLTGVFGFHALLRKAQRQHAPTHEIVVVLDAESGSQDRAEADSDYKGQRPAPAPELIESLAHIKRGLDASIVRWVEQDRYEADDVVATLTREARHRGRCVDIMSTDKDFYQLLEEPHVRLLNTARAEDQRYTTAATVLTRFGVRCGQWPDFRALTGDPADNIPGVRGIGAHTARRLLADGRHLEQVQRESLPERWSAQWSQALKWREMIRLDSRVPLPGGLLTGSSTPALPRADEVLETLGLWQEKGPGDPLTAGGLQ